MTEIRELLGRELLGIERPRRSLEEIRAFLQAEREIRTFPSDRLKVTLSNERVAAEYLRRFFDICEELLIRVESHELLLQRLSERTQEPPQETDPGSLQQAVLNRIRETLASVPDGTYLAITYDGKILASASTVNELTKALRALAVQRSQVFIHVKGREAAFRWD